MHVTVAVCHPPPPAAAVSPQPVREGGMGWWGADLDRLLGKSVHWRSFLVHTESNHVTMVSHSAGHLSCGVIGEVRAHPN